MLCYIKSCTQCNELINAKEEIGSGIVISPTVSSFKSCSLKFGAPLLQTMEDVVKVKYQRNTKLYALNADLIRNPWNSFPI